MREGAEWREEVAKRLARVKLEPGREAEIIEELAQDLEDRYEALLAGGATEAEARQAALEALDDPEALAGALRRVEREPKPAPAALGQASSGNLLADLWRDLRYGLGQLRRHPGFAALAVITLALGIGASTAIFAMLDAVMLQPLPYPHAGRLVMVGESAPSKGIDRMPLKYAFFPIYREDNKSFEAMAAFGPAGPPEDTIAGTSEKVSSASCTAGLFELLGVKPILGRPFLPSDLRWGTHRVAILSYGFWQRYYHGDRDVIGKVLSFNRRNGRFDYEVVGVMPRGFVFPYPLFKHKPDLWEGLRTVPLYPYIADRYWVVGRLKQNVTRTEAAADLGTIARGIGSKYPTYKGARPIVEPLEEEPLRPVHSLAWILFGAVSLLFLLACVNVSGMVLTQGVYRVREMGIRMALGASRGILIRQMLAESSLLAVAGGALGVLLSVWLTKGFSLLIPPNLYVPRLDQAGLSGMVLAYAVGLAVLATIFSGSLSAIRLSRRELETSLRSTTATGRLHGVLFRRPAGALLVLELALAVTLTTGGLLLARSLERLVSVDSSFDPGHLLMEDADIDGPVDLDMNGDRSRAIFGAVLERVLQVPGVKDATVSGGAMQAGGMFEVRAVGGGGPISRSFLPAEQKWADARFFQIMGMRVLQGRSFSETDTVKTPEVAVINQAMAQRYWPNESPMALKLEMGRPMPGQKPWYCTIVGVVAEGRRFGSGERAGPTLYLAESQARGPYEGAGLLIRTLGPARSMAAPVREAIESALPGEMSVGRIQTGSEIVEQNTLRLKFESLQLGIFAALALLLAAAGVYGLNSYVTSRRRHEIGVRIALGAQPEEVVRLIVAQGMKVATVGIVLGIAGAIVLARAARSLLFGINPWDPLAVGGAALLLALTAALGCYAPARREAQAGPLGVLREE